MPDLKEQISEQTKSAMKARDKRRVAALRLVNAELKRVEIDERRALSDSDVLSILTRMLKQRKDSEEQFRNAERMDLAEQEAFEIELIGEFMPQQMDDQEVDELIRNIISTVGAQSMKDMGKVMGLLKSEIAGRADMGTASTRVKVLLSG